MTYEGLRDGNDDESEPSLAEAIWRRFAAVGGVELKLHPPAPLSALRPFKSVDGIMSVKKLIRSAAPPDWLQKTWNGARQRRLDTLTGGDVDAEIGAPAQPAVIGS